MIEQLHYTWAKEGLQGFGQYQVTAASPGLRDLNRDLGKLALKLCRRSTSRSESQSSFGWVNSRNYRFVFLRRSTGIAPDGRPGNFLAHVLVAPIQELSIQQILTPGLGDLWWNGELLSTPELETLNPQNVGIECINANRLDTEELIAKLLDRGLSGNFGYPWETMLNAMSRISIYLPRQVDQIRGFSSHEEDSDLLSYFQIAGGGFSDFSADGSSISVTARTVARQLMLDDFPAQQNIKLMSSKAKVTDETAWKRFLATAFAYIEFRNDRVGDTKNILPILAFPELASELLSSSKGRRLVANAICQGDRGTVELLCSTSNVISSILLRTLAEEVFIMATHSGRLNPVLALLARYPMKLPRSFFQGMANSWLEELDFSTLQHCPIPLISEILNRFSKDAPGFESILQLPKIEEAIKLSILNTEIGENQKADILLHAFSLNSVSKRTLGTAYSMYPKLRKPLLLGAIQLNLLPDFLAAIEKRMTKSDFLDIYKSVTPKAIIPILHSISPRLDPIHILKVLDSISLERYAETNFEFQIFFDQTFHEYLAGMCNNEHYPLKDDIMASFTNSETAAIWRAFIHKCWDLSKNLSTKDIRFLVDILKNQRFQASRSPLQFAIQNALQSATNSAELTQIVEIYNISTMELLTLCQRVARRQLHIQNQKELAALVIDYALSNIKLDKNSLSALRNFMPLVTNLQRSELQHRSEQSPRMYRKYLDQLID